MGQVTRNSFSGTTASPGHVTRQSLGPGRGLLATSQAASAGPPTSKALQAVACETPQPDVGFMGDSDVNQTLPPGSAYADFAQINNTLPPGTHFTDITQKGGDIVLAAPTGIQLVSHQ